VLPTESGRRKLFSDAVKQTDIKRYKISVKPEDEALSPQQIKHQLKKYINRPEIKVGIKAVKTNRDRGILIETDSEEEMNTLSSEISSKLGERLEIIKHKLREPRKIIYNVPEEISTNIAAINTTQNPDILTNGENIDAKFMYKTRKGRNNIVMEVDPQARLQIVQTKLKIGWEICNVAEYLVSTRSYKCSRYNHKHYECKGEETCPLCAGKQNERMCSPDK
jgi:hypothetical protein